jgi:2-oxoisovalerate dehydrogenase E2 component (dihydrolipoyl transacylase)
MTSIKMPQLGESVAEGTIGKWLKAPGERVERDEPLVEVITDKVTAEIPSPVAGVVEQLVVPEGDTVPVGVEIAVIGDGAAEAASPQASAPSAEPVAAAEPSSASAPPRTMDTLSGPPRPPQAMSVAPTARTPGMGSASTAASAPDGEGRRASPLVRRLAREHGVDLSQVRGTGAAGRVTKDDILGFIEQRGLQPAAAPAQPAAQPTAAAAQAVPASPAPASQPAPPAAPKPAAATAEPGADEEYLPITPLRRMIAEHMVRSRQGTPDAWGLVEVDVTNLVRLRAGLLDDWYRRNGFELTFLPFMLKSVVESLLEHPLLNSAWTDERIVLKRRINLGIAVAVQDGLVVPVIHDADRKSIAGLAHTVRDLATRARSNKLTLADVRDGTFTVNNTGALGSIMSQPIINQPQAAIITMEAIVKRPVVTADDAIAIRSMMNACLSFDHRVLDGAAALRFLGSVKRRLESFGPDTPIY